MRIISRRRGKNPERVTEPVEARVDDVFWGGMGGREKIEWIPFGDGIFDFAQGGDHNNLQSHVMRKQILPLRHQRAPPVSSLITLSTMDIHSAFIDVLF